MAFSYAWEKKQERKMGVQIKNYKGKTYTYERGVHHWTEKDLARVAKYLHERRGASPVKILAAIASAIGLGWVFCRGSIAVQNVLRVFNIIKQITAALALSTVVKLVIEWLKGSKLIKIPALNWLLAFLIAVILLAQKILDLLTEMPTTLLVINNLTSVLDDGCRYIQETTGEVFEPISDFIEDIDLPDFDLPDFDIPNLSDIFD